MPKIVCPAIPAALANGLPPAGSAQWCAWIDEALAFFARLGETIAQWLDTNMDYRRWRNALNDYRNALINDKEASNTTWIAILGWFVDIIDTVLPGLDALRDVLRCAWDLRKVAMPHVHPEAYLGMLVVRNLLDAVKTPTIGSQSYLGFTFRIALTSPAVEQIVDHLIDYLLPIEMPGVGEATNAWASGLITTAQRDCVWKYFGRNPEGYESYALANTQAMSASQGIEYARRTQGAFGDEIAAVRRAGIADPLQQAGVLALYDRLHTEGQALQWNRVRADDAGFAQRYGLDAGFVNDYWPANSESLLAQGVTKEIAQHNYRAHWSGLGRGDLDQLFWRARPDNPLVKTPFGITDYEQHLAAIGYSPQQVAWLRQLAYRPLTVSDAIDLYRRGLLSAPDATKAYLDVGYALEDANLLMQRERFAAARWRAGEYGGWTPQAAGKAFAIGLLSHSQVSQILTPLGGGPADVRALEQRSRSDYQYRILQRAKARLLSSTVTAVKQSIQVGIMDATGAAHALTAVGWPATEAQGIATIESAAARTRLVKQAVSHLRTAMLAGEIAIPYVEHSLAQLGVVPSAIAQYVVLWRLQQTPGRKRRSASQIVADMAEGTLSIEDATVRLGNLGYGPSDIALYIGDAERKQVVTAPARAAAASMERGSRGGLQVAGKSYLPGLSKRTVVELKAQETPGKLAKWLKDGIVSEEYVANRLEMYGYEPSAIDNLIQDAHHVAPAKTAPVATPGSNGTPSSGGAGSDSPAG